MKVKKRSFSYLITKINVVPLGHENVELPEAYRIITYRYFSWLISTKC